MKSLKNIDIDITTMGCKKSKKDAVDVEAAAGSSTVDSVKKGEEDSSKGQLVFLLCVAALALTSIVLFTEQLVVRHLARPTVSFMQQQVSNLPNC